MNASSITIRLFITPQTSVRTTQKDAICFRIPEDVLQEKYPDLYKRKLRIVKYNDYKKELRKEATRVGLMFNETQTIFPPAGAWIKFYIPVPVSWSKKKKRLHNFEPHQSKPDTSNLHKAFEDALLKEDKIVWDYRASAFWYNSIKGYIEIVIDQVYLEKYMPGAANVFKPSTVMQD
jgi:Holliday junction resolvase RusA-like endonuclease